MNRCPNCSVNVFQKTCPFCGRNFENSILTKMKYPSYTLKVKKGSLILFLTVSIVLLCLFINIFTYSLYEKLWSFIVCASLGFVTSTIYILQSKKIHIGGKTLRLLMTTSVLFITIDAVNGFTRWSTTYVIPFATVVVALLFTIIALTKKNSFKEYFGYLLAISFISTCPIVLYLFNLSNELWSSMVATLVCVIIALGLYIFSKRNLKDELEKRFHV